MTGWGGCHEIEKWSRQNRRMIEKWPDEGIWTANVQKWSGPGDVMRSKNDLDRVVVWSKNDRTRGFGPQMYKKMIWAGGCHEIEKGSRQNRRMIEKWSDEGIWTANVQKWSGPGDVMRSKNDLDRVVVWSKNDRTRGYGPQMYKKWSKMIRRVLVTSHERMNAKKGCNGCVVSRGSPSSVITHKKKGGPKKYAKGCNGYFVSRGSPSSVITEGLKRGEGLVVD